MAESGSGNRQTVDPVRAAAHEAVSEALRRVALEAAAPARPAAPIGIPAPSAPSPPAAGAKRTVAAPPGAPPRTVARPPARAGDVGRAPDGARRGAAVESGELASRRAWFDRWFDEKYPELARRRPAAEAAAAAHAPQAVASQSVAEPVPAFDLEPRRLTAARLLLAGRCVSDVARSLGADRHTVSAWTRDPAFRREVRRMAVELPLDQLCPGAGAQEPRQSKRTHGARATGGA